MFLFPNRNGMVFGPSFQLFVFIKDKFQSFVSEFHTNSNFYLLKTLTLSACEEMH